MKEDISPIANKDKDSTLSKFVEAHESLSDDLEQSFDDVKISHQINNAAGLELDEVGKRFGLLGRRVGRDDSDYRVFLKSLVQSFKGTGTIDSIEKALASAIGTDTSNIVLTEYFDTNTYGVELKGSSWPSHTTDVIYTVSELADPSGVTLEEPVIYSLDTGSFSFDITVNTSHQTTGNAGLSSSNLAPLSQGGTWNLG